MSSSGVHPICRLLTLCVAPYCYTHVCGVTVELLKAGDTFTGMASFHDCFTVDEHETGLIIVEAQGNAFRGSMVSKIGKELRTVKVRGFFYIPGRQLIVVPEDYSSRSVSMVCSYNEGSDNDVDCKILTDHMTKSCGSVGLSRDRISE